VDNDGNAEIVFASNNDASACSTGSNFPNGIAVWGDASDAWVSARRVWNEHAYHVTNVLESGGVPVKEPESFKTYNGRRYNTYRSNPRSFGAAPDLKVKGAQVSSPDAACGQLSSLLDISFEIANIGDVRVGPGVVIGFYGTWSNPALMEPLYQDVMMTPLQLVLQSSIEPGSSIFLQVGYAAMNNSPGVLPDSVQVVVDDGNAQRECNEDNNTFSRPVDAGMQLPDLRIQLGAASEMACPTPRSRPPSSTRAPPPRATCSSGITPATRPRAAPRSSKRSSPAPSPRTAAWSASARSSWASPRTSPSKSTARWIRTTPCSSATTATTRTPPTTR
jgi:hypothetical protein